MDANDVKNTSTISLPKIRNNKEIHLDDEVKDIFFPSEFENKTSKPIINETALDNPIVSSVSALDNDNTVNTNFSETTGKENNGTKSSIFDTKLNSLIQKLNKLKLEANSIKKQHCKGESTKEEIQKDKSSKRQILRIKGNAWKN